MSYIKLVCPLCESKHEVSNFYIKENKILSLDELIKQICTCSNIIETQDYNEQSIDEFIEDSIFKEDAFNQLNKITTIRNKQKVYSVYNYVPESRLDFKYDIEFNKAALKAEDFFKKNGIIKSYF